MDNYSTTLIFSSSAPLEIIIGGTFLYQLLGWSAFAGFIVLIAGWPLNSFIARRSIRIQKGVLAARDKRMGVLNELISAVSLSSLDSSHGLRLTLGYRSSSSRSVHILRFRRQG